MVSRITPALVQLIDLLHVSRLGGMADDLAAELRRGRPLSADTEAWIEWTDEADSEPYPPDEQVEVALEFLRVRLIEPQRRAADAHRLVGELSDGGVTNIMVEGEDSLVPGWEPQRWQAAMNLEKLLPELRQALIAPEQG